ncbi:MAG: 5'-3' exonuclease [Actinomycetota bacterium]
MNQSDPSRPLALLIDSASLIYRAYFSASESLKAPDGMLVNAAYGFLNMLSRLVEDRDPDLLVCADDASWRPAWRVDLIDSYKAHRVGDPLEELDTQLPVIFEIVQATGIAVAAASDYEAEDVIGALIPRCPGAVEIVSGDRDLFQLVRDPEVCVLYPMRGVSQLTRVDEAYIERKYSIPGRAYGEYAVLRGDTSDGLPGVMGVGEKTAAALIRKHGSLSAIIEAALTGDGTGALGKVRNSLDYLDCAVQVSLITADAPVGEVAMQRPSGDSNEALQQLAARYGLTTPVNRLLNALSRPRSASRNA